MMRRRRSQPTEMRQVVAQVLDALGMEDAAKAHRLALCWKQAVGPEVAAHCEPVGLRGGVLEARVDSSVWSQQLQLRSPEILAALRRELGEEAPTALRFRVG